MIGDCHVQFGAHRYNTRNRLTGEWRGRRDWGEPHDTPYSLREFAFVDSDGALHRVGHRCLTGLPLNCDPSAVRHIVRRPQAMPTTPQELASLRYGPVTEESAGHGRRSAIESSAKNAKRAIPRYRHYCR
jgi:hypothetical protein